MRKMQRELQFDELVTLRDLINEYPEVLDMPMAVVARDDLYEFVGEPNVEGNIGKVFVDKVSFNDDNGNLLEPVQVLVFAPNDKYRDWDN